MMIGRNSAVLAQVKENTMSVHRPLIGGITIDINSMLHITEKALSAMYNLLICGDTSTHKISLKDISIASTIPYDEENLRLKIEDTRISISVTVKALERNHPRAEIDMQVELFGSDLQKEVSEMVKSQSYLKVVVAGISAKNAKDISLNISPFESICHSTRELVYSNGELSSIFEESWREILMIFLKFEDQAISYNNSRLPIAGSERNS